MQYKAFNNNEIIIISGNDDPRRSTFYIPEISDPRWSERDEDVAL